jgi:hypothetical protein
MKTVADIQKEALEMVKKVFPDPNTIHIHFHVDSHYCRIIGGRESEPEIKYRLYVDVYKSGGNKFEFSQTDTSVGKLLHMLQAHLAPMKDLEGIGI